MKPPLIILGMHRSGTSLISNWLMESGIHLGEKLQGASEFNAWGYFEDIEFVEFNKKLLRRLGVNETGHEQPLHRITEPDAKMIEEIRIFVNKRRRSTQWGWKDPRTCLLADAYRSACPDAHYLIVLRQPANSVASLVRRERVMQSRSRRYFKALGMHLPHQRYFELRYNAHYLQVVGLYFDMLRSHLNEAMDRTVVMDLDNLLESSDRCAKRLSEIGIDLKPIPISKVFRQNDLTQRKTLDFVDEKLMEGVMGAFNTMLESAV